MVKNSYSGWNPGYYSLFPQVSLCWYPARMEGWTTRLAASWPPWRKSNPGRWFITMLSNHYATIFIMLFHRLIENARTADSHRWKHWTSRSRIKVKYEVFRWVTQRLQHIPLFFVWNIVLQKFVMFHVSHFFNSNFLLSLISLKTIFLCVERLFTRILIFFIRNIFFFFLLLCAFDIFSLSVCCWENACW